MGCPTEGGSEIPPGTKNHTQLKEIVLLSGSGASREQIVPSPNWFFFLFFFFFCLSPFSSFVDV